ncbi:hypothetical protein ACFODO_22900 [Acinetobacter sichuanensis]|uniref:Uncharacterized protein n=1 Tax=Acinetobacter sichuanensis TaxID=2136183 RepID=A0ABV7BK75_9GAMM
MDIQNPEKIEIEGLKTIHKLCKFGANHNMEGCSFTEIVERMFDELSKAQAVPEGFVLVSKDRIVKAINKIEILFEEDPLLALGELLSIQQDLNTMIEAQEQGHDGL